MTSLRRLPVRQPERPPPTPCVLDWACSSWPLQALKAECVEFLSTGSIYPPAVGSGGGWTANPTLLQPGSRAWQVHYGALPFLGYVPLDPAKHGGLVRAQGPRQLTEVGSAAEDGMGWGSGRPVSGCPGKSAAGRSRVCKPVSVAGFALAPASLAPAPAGLPRGAAGAAAGLAGLPRRMHRARTVLVPRRALALRGAAGSTAGGCRRGRGAGLRRRRHQQPV